MAMPVTWRHPGAMPAGRTGSGAFGRGVPFLYTESPEADDLSELYLGAVLRLLAAEGLMHADDAPRASWPTRRLVGPGDLDHSSIRAPATGLVEVCVRPLDRVEAGQSVATWTDAWFGRMVELTATEPGVVVVARSSRGVAAGEMIVHLAQDDAD